MGYSLWRWLFAYQTASVRATVADDLIRNADAARDAQQFAEAAVLYREALRLRPGDGPIHVQCGNMFKDIGNWTVAEEHYGQAARLMPLDADVVLQTGHLLKLAGRLSEAETEYRRALTLSPGWIDPIRELEGLLATEVSDGTTGPSPRAISDELDGLAPELAPRTEPLSLQGAREGVVLHRLGTIERGRWGPMQTLRGVVAIRGVCVAAVPVVKLEIRLDDMVIHRSDPQEIASTETPSKFVFNAWINLSQVAAGRYRLTLDFRTGDGRTKQHHEAVVIASPLRETDYPQSDGLVDPPDTDTASLEAAINDRPSIVRPARRQLFDSAPRTILIQRIDQLGDMVCSVPALRRLRSLFPTARLIGLLSPSNAELAATLDLFDDIIVVDFPDHPTERRRVMPLAGQFALRDRLRGYDVDLAIDLSDSGVSRPLLHLAGARFTYGFRPNEFSWLSAAFEGATHDPLNGLERVPHTTKLMGLIAWLETLADSHATVTPRPGLERNVLASLGRDVEKRFVVLHTGARLAFSRWPHFATLATLILERTDLDVIMMADDDAVRAHLPEQLLGSARFQLLDKRLAFDQFDALASFCAGFVGNDSGPKHLAALRGAPVVSVHMARINWNEWGQENRGFIVSRKVPCAGCSIHHEPEECGKAFACITQIKPEEVFDALMAAMTAHQASA